MLIAMGGFSRCLVTLAAAMLAAHCSSPTEPTRGIKPKDPAVPNTLTDDERAAGWLLLFDGRSTAGWRGFQQAGMPAGWRAIDGALTRDAGGGDVISIDQFANFELTLE